MVHIAPLECINNSYSSKPFKVETSEIAEIMLLIKSCLAVVVQAKPMTLAEFKTIGK